MKLWLKLPPLPLPTREMGGGGEGKMKKKKKEIQKQCLCSNFSSYLSQFWFSFVCAYHSAISAFGSKEDRMLVCLIDETRPRGRS